MNKTKNIFTIVLVVLVLISLVQAFQLNGLKAKLDDAGLSLGKASSTVAVASNGGGSGGGISTPSSLDSLPQMVGGC